MNSTIRQGSDVVAYLDEAHDGTVTVTTRSGHAVATFTRRSFIDTNWRHHTAHTDAARWVRRTLAAKGTLD